MDQLSRLENSLFHDSVMDDVIANLLQDFKDEGVAEETLQQLKQMWRLKLQKISGVDPTTPIPNMASNSGSTEPKKDAAAAATAFSIQPKRSGQISSSSGKQLQQQALSNVARSHSAENDPAPAAFPLTIKWVFHRPPVLRPCSKAVAHPKNLSRALQLDGDLPPIEEESSDNEDNEELPLPDDDDSSLNSGDDLVGEDATDEDTFQAENVIICQFDKVRRIRNRWKFELTNGVMCINGKVYVFKECSGAALW